MKTYFDQGNFEPFVYKRLNEVIDEFKDDSNSYVVFDYDNTSIIMDIEDNLNVYLMEHLEYKLTPEVFYKTLTNTHYHEELSKRSEEHTSELQSRFDLVCRLLLEKKKTTNNKIILY